MDHAWRQRSYNIGQFKYEKSEKKLCLWRQDYDTDNAAGKNRTTILYFIDLAKWMRVNWKVSRGKSNLKIHRLPVVVDKIRFPNFPVVQQLSK